MRASMRVSRPFRYQHPVPIAATMVSGIAVVSSITPAASNRSGRQLGNTTRVASVIMDI